VDLGYRFFKEYWGKGFATESAYASLKYGFEKLGMTEIIAKALPENPGSIKVMKKLGMTFLKAALCEDLNAHWYRIRREEFNDFVSASEAAYSVRFK
jgi:ribosomal-protein-alanine N-acetyltransferase